MRLSRSLPSNPHPSTFPSLPFAVFMALGVPFLLTVQPQAPPTSSAPALPLASPAPSSPRSRFSLHVRLQLQKFHD